MTPFSNYSSDGIPSREECVTMDWPLYQLTVEGARAYQNLYDNHNGLRDSWAAYWGVLASNFSHFENLFGYDLMNEPFAGDIYRNPLLLFPGVADRLNLQQFYESANTEIRKFDKKSIVMFEGLTWDNFRIGFTDVPGGNSFRNRTGLSYHFYPSGPYLFRMAGTFRERLADAKRLGCGLLMTEFDGPNSYASQWDIVEMADNFLQRWGISFDLSTLTKIPGSWTTWQYKPFVDVTGSGDDVINQTTGAPREDRVRFYSRTFPHAIQGTLIQGSIFLNRTDGTFRMKFHGDPRVKGRTEIRVHPEYDSLLRISISYLSDHIYRIWYPNGLLVNVNPSSKITAYYNATLNPSLIELGLTTEALLDDEISIEIIPKLRPPRDDGVKPPDDP